MPSDVPLAPGLYVVATPIGNLEDITLRALRVLRTADLIACEDTRQTQKLLNHFSIATRAISYHEHNEAERAAELVQKLAGGARVALVSDAGTPAISDPGYRVVKLAIERGVPVFTVPGVSAVVAALAASGLPTDEFLFLGFLPAREGQRRTLLERHAYADQTLVCYEAPHRIAATLADVAIAMGDDRRVVIARELTKLHEEFLRGTAASVVAELRRRGDVKGEMVLLIGKAEAQSTAKAGTDLRARLAQLMRDEKLDDKAALKRLAKETGIGKSELYRELHRKR